MTYTLWRATDLLGEADLGPLAAGAPDSLTGPFRPTPAFAAAWPAFAALAAAQGPLLGALGALPRDAGPDAIRARLVQADPADALGAALAVVDALGLEVRDAAGRALAGVRAVVSSWALPGVGELTPEERATAEREAAAAGVVLPLGGPHYILVVMPRAVTEGARAAGRAGAI